jgi:hypothetical protein
MDKIMMILPIVLPKFESSSIADLLEMLDINHLVFVLFKLSTEQN